MVIPPFISWQIHTVLTIGKCQQIILSRVRVTERQGARDVFGCLHTRVTLREPTTRARCIHAQRTVIYGVVIVVRNLERTNQNDGFKMTALELLALDAILFPSPCWSVLGATNCSAGLGKCKISNNENVAQPQPYPISFSPTPL